jgi:hypothetical protein
LRVRKTAKAGVLQWKAQNESMVTLFERHPWVEDMVVTIGEEVVKTRPWGLLWRVAFGSGMSFIALATDIYVIYVYLGEEENAIFGWAMLSMVLASMLLQIIEVVIQHGRRGWQVRRAPSGWCESQSQTNLTHPFFRCSQWRSRS